MAAQKEQQCELLSMETTRSTQLTSSLSQCSVAGDQLYVLVKDTGFVVRHLGSYS